MGWYTVTKRIKGNPYLYRQRTWREGGKVRTESHYIGVGGDASRGSGTGSRGGSSREDAGNGAKEDPRGRDDAGTTELKEAVPAPEKPVQTLRIRPGVWQTNISTQALLEEERQITKRMAAMGIDVTNIDPVIVATSGSVRRRRSLITGRYIVTAPRRGGNRTQFKQEYRRALADRWIREVRKNDPFAYEHLRTEMDAGYRETKHALTRYLLNTNARGKWTLTLQMMWTKQMPVWFRKNIKPEILGLVDHAPVSGWHSDAVNLSAEVMQRGYKATVSKYRGEGGRVNLMVDREWRAYKRMTLMDALRGKKRAQLRKIRRLHAREIALSATERKLEALGVMWAD